MTKLGMNADAVESLANKLDAHASGIGSAIAQIEALVNRATSEWRGNDAQAFSNWWHSKHKPALQRAHDSIAGLAQSAKNNVADQKGVSTTSGGARHAAAVVSPGAGQPSGGHAPAPTDLAARQTAVDHFVTAYPVGMSVGPGDSHGQCVGLFEEYSMRYVHTPEFFTSNYDGAAYDFWTHYNDIPHLSEYYSQLPPGSLPQPGDVAIWDSTTPYSGGYGHIAVVTGATGNTVNILQQNAVRDHVSTGSFSVGESHLLGYLRPKTLAP
jgi:uncharacterized protein YukE